MKRLGLILLPLGFAGCNGLFGIDVPPLEQSSPRAGTSGAAGTVATAPHGETGGDNGLQTEAGAGGEPQAGSDSGGQPQAGSGHGGKPTVTAGTGGADDHGGGGGGTNTGGIAGVGGSPSGGKGGAAGSGAGSSGAGGMSNVFPHAGDACAQEGAVACPGYEKQVPLNCYLGSWQPSASCGQGEYCDNRTGACAPALPGCAGHDPGYRFCSTDGYSLETCGPDLVTAVAEACVYGCDPMLPTCPPPQKHSTVVTVEQPPALYDVGAYWPGPSIPVCFATPETANEWGTVQDEIERTWGRYASIRFDGFGACDEDSTGVRVAFEPAGDEPADTLCATALASIDRIGYPGDGGTVNITLCLDYVDADGNTQTTAPDLLRIIARHEFGHALGFDDLSKTYDATEFMARAIDTSRTYNYNFLSQHISLLEQAYGFKPRGSIVDPRGFCLTNAAGTPSFVNCDGSSAQAFHIANDQIHVESDDTCLRADPSDGSLSFSACDPNGADPTETWHFNETLLRGYSDVCLYMFGGPYVNPCELIQPKPYWNVESIDGGKSFRFLWPGTPDECITEEPSATMTFDLSYIDPPCSACNASDTFCDFAFTEAGQIARDDWCLTTPGVFETYNGGNEDGFSLSRSNADAEIEPCSLEPRAVWSLNTQLVNGNGQALAEYSDSDALFAIPSDAIGARAIETANFEYYVKAQ